MKSPTFWDASEDFMVRHEAAEAMGELAHASALPLFKRYASDQSLAQEIRKTCLLVVHGIQWPQIAHGNAPDVPYTSVDPAPAHHEQDVDQLRTVICDTSKRLFERDKSMFALRNKGGEQAVLGLCAGMQADKESALFRHAVAYVLGQMQHQASIPTLQQFLRDQNEH
ncbi:deoxyhypusine hydroxylase [Gracilaria domingensis]|nr:deoxyhypusine hydroxylase [Gracilaria domingensis]